jgi:hypothetical protein
MTGVTRAQADEIRTLQEMKDEEIDFIDIPLTSDWSKAAVGTLYRPIKKSLTIRVDADVRQARPLGPAAGGSMTRLK